MSQTYFRLVVVEGVSQGKVIDLDGQELVLGRDPSADIVIDAPAISRRHLRLHIDGKHLLLEDLNSSNGTYLNGQKIQGRAPVKHGDQIGLGRAVRLRLELVRGDDSTVMDGVGETALDEVGLDEAPVTKMRKSPETIIGQVEEQKILPPQLEVTVAGAQPQWVTLDQPRFTLGRWPDNMIIIQSPIVSRHLAVIERTPQGYRLESLPDIANPILLEGRPLSGGHILRPNDKLRIGGEDPGMMVTLRFVARADMDIAAPPERISFKGKERVTLGRDESNDVRLDSPLVSRFHAQVERVGQRYRVSDLRSANGTFVNDQRIEGDTWLKPEDTIRVGPYRFVMGANSISQVNETSGLQVEVVGLNKWVRKDLNLLKDISLLFQPTEFVVVVGQSGGGKSTLVDAVAGYRPATHGQVLVNGVDVYRNFDAIRNEIGFVPQRDIIHMELTVNQALDYAAQLRMPPDTTREERHKRVNEVLEDLDLLHRRDVQISGLSGGQQKRVSIGVELLTSPGLFFLDEPTSGLDPGTETALMQLMRRLADHGRTIILITHATKNVMLADKVVFLARGGNLAWFGPPDEALAYFDQYRSERDRRARPIEFDTIYAILDDPSKGTPEDWAKRYRMHAAYHKYIVKPLSELGHNPQPKGGQAAAQAVGAAPAAAVAVPRKQIPTRAARKQVSTLRQFFILSARNARILTRDKPALILMLLVAPLISMLDVVLSFVLGRRLFSYSDGNMASVVTSLFMPIIYAVMVGALAQMREFVKESEIYKRERLVNLRVVPYVLSKVWVAALIGLYQALVYTGVHYLAFEMPGGLPEFMQIYFTLYLATLAGMLIGLVSSALAPNANAAPLIVILFLMPQFTLGGAMIPVPSFVSAPTSTRWAFEALMAITGPGSDVAGDTCWALPEEVRDKMSLDTKTAYGCRCMGVNALRESSCSFPGLGKFYDPVLDEAEPDKPEDIGERPADPVMPPPPPEPGADATPLDMANYLQELKDYQAQVERIQNDFKALLSDYQARADEYKTQATQYQEDLTEWKLNRTKAVGGAEGLINPFYSDFAWTFVDKTDSAAYWTKLVRTWVSQGVIISVLLVITILLIWRKDRL